MKHEENLTLNITQERNSTKQMHYLQNKSIQDLWEKISMKLLIRGNSFFCRNLFPNSPPNLQCFQTLTCKWFGTGNFFLSILLAKPKVIQTSFSRWGWTRENLLLGCQPQKYWRGGFGHFGLYFFNAWFPLKKKWKIS